MLCFWDIPDSMPALVSSGVTSGGRHKVSLVSSCATCVPVHARVSSTPLLCEMQVKLCLPAANRIMHLMSIACFAAKASPILFLCET